MNKPCAILILGVCAVVGGCIEYDQPISNEEETAVDERFVGDWKDVSNYAGSNDRYRFSLGSISDRTRMMTVVMDDDVTQPIELCTTKIGDRSFLSCQGTDVNGKKRSAWEICQYKFVSKDEIQVFMMDPEKVAKLIRSGMLQGKVTRQNPGFILSLVGATSTYEAKSITTPREKLRQYLTENPDECFEMNKPLYHLKRAKLKNLD